MTETYDEDRPLFKDLGLKPFGFLDLRSEWHECGVVKLDSAHIKVEVCCMPAQFWRFTIEGNIQDVRSGVLSTGSGTLTEYWPSVLHWANGCLVFEAAA